MRTSMIRGAAVGKPPCLTSRVTPFVPHSARTAPCLRHRARHVSFGPVHSSYVATSVDIPVSDWDGNIVGTEPIALVVADRKTQKGLVHRYVVTVQQNMRSGTASTLTRGEVRGGGRKPYKQKGTGKARRGSQRSPLIVGGGVIFGPKPKDWSISMNKKERRLALATALQSAAVDMIVVDDVESAVPETKTKALVQKLTNLGANPMEQKVLLILSSCPPSVERSARNVEKLFVNSVDGIRVLDVLNADKIVVEQHALNLIRGRHGFPFDHDLEDLGAVEGSLANGTAHPGALDVGADPELDLDESDDEE